MMRFRSGLYFVTLVAALAGGCGGDTVIPLPSKFIAVDAGVLHSCGILEGSAAYCWGSNTEGQLGDGSHSMRTTPAPVIGELQFTAISAGGGHTCGMASGGKVYCWGFNNVGQLGDASTTNRATPAAVAGTVTFQFISAGASYTCGLASGGAAHCWGFNDNGQLGDGTTIDRTSPTAVSGGRAFTSVAAGAFHTCGVTAAGEIYCWGKNENGELGNDQLTDSSVPVKVASSVAFASVDVGFRHTCAAATDGRAFCWGSNDQGQLGLGPDASGAPQRVPVEVPGDRRFSSVSSGAGVFTCAVEQGTGAGYCWGYNGSGQLGGQAPDSCVDEGGIASPCALSPQAVSGGRFFARISANTQHVCGLAIDGVAYCWGLGNNGQLGEGSKGDAVFRLEPVRVAGQP